MEVSEQTRYEAYTYTYTYTYIERLSNSGLGMRYEIGGLGIRIQKKKIYKLLAQQQQ